MNQLFEEGHGQQTRTDDENGTAKVGWVKARNNGKINPKNSVKGAAAAHVK